MALSYLDGSSYRDLADVPENMREDVFNQQSNEELIFQKLELLLKSEFYIESQIEALPKLKMVTIWDVEQNAQRVVEDSAAFLGSEKVGDVTPVKTVSADTKFYDNAVASLKEKLATMLNVK